MAVESWKPVFLIALFMGTTFYFAGATDLVSFAEGEQLIRDTDDIPACTRALREDVIVKSYVDTGWKDDAAIFEDVELFDHPDFTDDGIRLERGLSGTWESEQFTRGEFNITKFRLEIINASENATLELKSRLDDEENFTTEITVDSSSVNVFDAQVGNVFDRYNNVGSVISRLEFERDGTQFKRPSVLQYLIIGDFKEQEPESQLKCTFAVFQEYGSVIFVDSDNEIVEILFNAMTIILIVILLEMLRRALSTLPFFGG